MNADADGLSLSGRYGQRGIALILVLWLIVLLTSIIGLFAFVAQTERLQGRAQERGMTAEEAARAALEYAVVRISSQNPKLRWLPDGREYPWSFNTADIRVKIIDETGKIDLNTANIQLLTDFFKALGVEPAQAARLGAAVVDWRDMDTLTQPSGGAEDADYAAAGRSYGAKDAPFDTIAELNLILGISPEIFAKAAPHITIYSGLSTPNQQYASEVVMRAMGIDQLQIDAQLKQRAPNALLLSTIGMGSGTYSVESTARLHDGREGRIQAVIRIGAGAMPGTGYSTLRWEQGVSIR